MYMQTEFELESSYLDLVPATENTGERLTIQQRFEEFHYNNPMVYHNLMLLINSAKLRGMKKIGIGMVYEVLRWNYYMRTSDPNSYCKLSNDYRSRYSRLIMQKNPELKGFITTREITTP